MHITDHQMATYYSGRPAQRRLTCLRGPPHRHVGKDDANLHLVASLRLKRSL